METVLEAAARNALKARITACLVLPVRQCVYADVGAAWGVDNIAVNILKQNGRIRVIGFEPDENEFKKLPQSPAEIYLPYGVGDVDGTHDFYVTAHAAQSSFYESDGEAFPAGERRNSAAVVAVRQVPIRRFDSMIADGTIPQVDYLKADAQGYELNILKGFGEKLRSVTGIRLECHLRPLYKNQPVFSDVYAYMRSQRFILRDIRPMFPETHELVEIEAYFSNGEVSAQEHIMKFWELIHDIPPGRILLNNSWTSLVI